MRTKDSSDDDVAGEASSSADDVHDPGGGQSGGEEGGGVTVAETADLLRVPSVFLHNLGLSDIYVDSAPTVRIPFLDGSAKVASVRLLSSLAGDIRWKTDSKPFPYGVSRLGDARDTGYV